MADPIPTGIRDEHARLCREIDRHNHRYHVLSKPEISDAEYDRLLLRLEELERLHPDLVTPDSPTQKVGGSAIEGFEKATHALPMLSLGKAYIESEILDWAALMERELGRPVEPRFTVEPKIDGDSLELLYEKGVLVRASTRGDGKIGEDVTHTVRTIRSVPLRLLGDAPDLIEVRGEAYVTTADFRKLNQDLMARGGESFANPRNFTSGSIKQLDPKVTASRPIRFLSHGLGRVKGPRFARHSDAMAALRSFGLPVVDFEMCDSIAAVGSFHARMIERRETMPFEIDGIVVKVDDLATREALGERSKSPRWAIAWKFPAREEVTQVLAIDWQVGRTGKLTPVARLKPVPISGVTVSNATLHNLAQLERLDVRAGDWVVVTRSGDVIPYVVQVIETRRPEGAPKTEPPSKCPSCGAAPERTEADVVCPDRFGCPDQLKGAVEHFCSRGAMNVEGLGTEWIDVLVDRGLVRSVADLYELTESQFLTLSRMGEKLARKLLASLAASKKTTLSRLVNALGIRHVGEATAAALADHFGGLEKLLDASMDDLQEVPDVGPRVAESIREFFGRPEHRKVIGKLLAAGIEYGRPEPKSDRLAGKVVVFTGGLDAMTREEAKRLVHEHGGKTAESISRHVTLVVAGPGGGSKLEKARKLGIEIVDEAGFLRIVGPR
ncbi:MAG: NAD-dependent DNA ligase LigA [Planctomycetes bacterium]|nr:NAD-dependent DNA ligase LigA [Planctomycetota bacterium]